ncbi:MAG: VWA domain-containing protein [Acidobacteria bacterium]|nr:VWA domain-containing protein [Acidobacteriota bacterium]
MLRRCLMCLMFCGVLATDNLYYVNLQVTTTEDKLVVAPLPQRLVKYDLLKDDQYNLSREMMEYMLDAPFRQTAFLFRTLERNRGAVMGSAPAGPLPILQFKIECALRDITGEELEMHEYEVDLLLSNVEGEGIIRSGTTSLPFKIAEIKDSNSYEAFLNHVLFPDGPQSFAVPTTQEFLVDIYFKWPKVLVDDKIPIFDLFPSLILWNKGDVTKVMIHLGTTYGYREDGQWQFMSNDLFEKYAQSIDAYSQALKLIADGDEEDAIAALEDYLAVSPADKKALDRLMQLYLDYDMKDEAYSLVSRFQPFFATIRGGIDNQRSLESAARRKRNLLLGKRGQFKRDKSVLLKITSPEQDDLVTGTTKLNFSLAEAPSPILQIDCFIDEQMIASLTEPPFEVPFTVDGVTGSSELRVVAYFENETYQSDEITVQALQVDTEEYVNLVGVRAVVTRGPSNLLLDLEQSEFSVEENGEKREIIHFKKDTAPLRIAILVDNSISMFGKKLYNAQYAVHTFLSKLQPEDRASIYTFDNKVLRVSDLTNDFASLQKQVFTMSPQLATSLYDAILVAKDHLEGQNGTKVIIVVSDGSDSASAVTDIHVAKALRGSPVMVYSIILPGDFLGNSNQAGNMFLQEIARVTGSISTRVRNVKNLDETFDEIYLELKSFYYFDYYSNFLNPEERELEVKISRLGAKARFRAIN